MNPIIFGHRGVPLEATENSLASFALIKKYNIPGVELDIHLTKDNILVVHHDFNTRKLTGIDLEISDSHHHEIKDLKLNKKEEIPTLEDVFNLLGDSVIYDLEIKSRGKNRDKLCTLLLEMIEKNKLTERVIVSSFDPVILRHFNRIQKKMKLSIETGIIYSRDKEVPIYLRRGLGVFLTNNSIIKPEKNLLKGFHFWLYRRVLNKKCFTWTSDKEIEWKELDSSRVDGICTNRPKELLEFQRNQALSYN